VIRHASFYDINTGRNVHEALRLLEAIQFFDEHGEGCPADWSP
jgi:peroxiredoxin (alkyl hydroperoxide reductase subunit C)